MILTQNADTDDRTNEDYKDICDEIRNFNDDENKAVMSWANFITKIGSFKFPAQWADWRKDKRPLTWDMKNDLRRAVGLPELPEPVHQVLQTYVGENATIYINDKEVDIGIATGMYRATYARLSMGMIIDPVVNKPKEDKPKEVKRKRKKKKGFTRPSAMPNSLNEWRKHLGLTWEDIIYAGVLACSAKLPEDGMKDWVDIVLAQRAEKFK